MPTGPRSMPRRGRGTNTSNELPAQVHDRADGGVPAASRHGRDRFEPLEFDHCWLSDTPDVIASSTWGNAVRRMVTWAKFRDRTTGGEFYFWNTHLDHEVESAREKSAELIRRRIGLLPPGAPLFLAGDFNAVSREAAPTEFSPRAQACRIRGSPHANVATRTQTPSPDPARCCAMGNASTGSCRAARWTCVRRRLSRSSRAGSGRVITCRS
jgi:Endonuclease/Exonuclease/phosphatase family